MEVSNPWSRHKKIIFLAFFMNSCVKLHKIYLFFISLHFTLPLPYTLISSVQKCAQFSNFFVWERTMRRKIWNRQAEIRRICLIVYRKLKKKIARLFSLRHSLEHSVFCFDSRLLFSESQCPHRESLFLRTLGSTSNINTPKIKMCIWVTIWMKKFGESMI